MYAAGVDRDCHLALWAGAAFACDVRLVFVVKALGGLYACGGGLVSAQSSDEVAHLAISVCLEYVGGEVAAQAYSAEEPYGACCGYLAKALPHVVQGNVDRTGYAAQCVFVGGTHIDEGDCGRVGVAHLTPVQRLHLSAEYIAGDVARNGNGVFG